MTLLTLALALSCHLSQDRAEVHLERGRQFLAEKQDRKALIEFLSAARYRPDDYDLDLSIARLSMEQGFIGDASDFYSDALALRPDDSNTKAELAELLMKVEPERSEVLIEELIRNESSAQTGWHLKAKLALSKNDIGQATRNLNRARSLGRANPENDWINAMINEAQTRKARRKNPLAPASPYHYDKTLAYYKRYLDNGGRNVLVALSAQARLLEELPNRSERTHDAYLSLFDRSLALGSRNDQLKAARETSRFARRRQDLQLERRALGRWLELSPTDLEAWNRISALNSREHPETELLKNYAGMLETLATNANAHVIFAKALSTAASTTEAVDYLRELMHREEVDNVILGVGIAEIELAAGNLNAGKRVIGEIESTFPERHETLVAKAHYQFLNGQLEDAAVTLGNAGEGNEIPTVYYLLAQVEKSANNQPAALDAIRRAIQLDTDFSADKTRLKAEILTELTEHKAAVHEWLTIERNVGLKPQERILLSAAYYDAGAPGMGRKILMSLIQKDQSKTEAALNLYKRESKRPNYQNQLLDILEEVYEIDPNDIELLSALSDLDYRQGHKQKVFDRINEALSRDSQSAQLYQLRARYQLNFDRFKQAIGDAQLAIALAPGQGSEEAYEILSAAFIVSSGATKAISNLESRLQKTGLSANQLALLARLHHYSGNLIRAKEIYESSLRQGSELIFVKNDLAFLLAESGEDLDRALSLAQQAVDAPGEDLALVDTLGYVYLRKGMPDAALWKFRLTTNGANPPVADYYHHLALAFAELGRDQEARDALLQALSIDPNHMASAALLNRLDRHDSTLQATGTESS